MTDTTDTPDARDEQTTETITLEIEAELDAWHSDGFRDVVAAAPDRESVIDGFEEQVSRIVESEGVVEQLVYQARQQTVTQQRQAQAQLAQQAQQAATGGSETDNEDD